MLWAALTVCELTVCELAGTSAQAGDWPHWRGPEQNGISREKGLLESWSPEGENLLWKSDIGGRSTPIVMNGRVYVNCRTDDDFLDPVQKLNAREQVVCWDAESGKVLWKKLFTVSQTDIAPPRIGWASMVADPETKHVYQHSVAAQLRCFTEDGNLVWERNLNEEFGVISGYGGRTQTPIIDGDKLIVSFLTINWGDTKAPPPKHRYYAFDKKNGELLWVSTPGVAALDTNYTVPMIAVVDGVRMLIGGNGDGNIHAMNAHTGEKLWDFKLSRRGLNASVAVEGNYVYVGNGEDNWDNTKFGRVACIDARGRGDITETHCVWKVDDIRVGYTALLVKDGILYCVTDGGVLVAFDAQNGNRLWEFSLGTVGKGSPVWADGKIYVMEVNGRIHILRPSREGCQSLSKVHLKARVGAGDDEIYASPAIANGKVYFLTRDNMYCVGKKDASPQSDPIPALPAEHPAEKEVASIQVYPYEVTVRTGDTVKYRVQTFDKWGHALGLVDAPLTTTLPGAKIEAGTLTIAKTEQSQAGTITAEYQGKTATARLRAFAPFPWKWDFTGFKEKEVPPTWIGAFLKFQPMTDGDNVVMKVPSSKARPSLYIHMGAPNMKGYTVQADLLTKEQKRQMSNLGITCQGYNLILQGNAQVLRIEDWAPVLRASKEIDYAWDPEEWYTLKMRVDVQGESGTIRGKVWKRGTPEPEAWTIEVTDPYVNQEGSPGIYIYSLTDAALDNVLVTESK